MKIEVDEMVCDVCMGGGNQIYPLTFVAYRCKMHIDAIDK